MRLEIYNSNKLNFVELNYTGGNDTLVRCDKESLYIDSIVFNLFSPCFENANKLYEYYGPTKYNSRKIIPLRNELIKHHDKLNNIDDVKNFEKMISCHFLGKEFLDELQRFDPKYSDNWTKHKEKLVAINKKMIELTERCAYEERIIWVVGY